MIRVPESARRDVLHVCRRLYERGLVAGADGNVSLRLGPDAILATPTGRSKGFLNAEDLVVCDLSGKQTAGSARLTTEIKIHLAVYAQRDDVCGIVHAHPPYATAFAVAHRTPQENMMPEAYLAVGKVALAEYGTPSTDELADKMRPYLREYDAVLLANHGALTSGRDVVAACNRMEALEQMCRIACIAQMLGGSRPLDAAQLAQLDAIRGVYATAAPGAPCYACGQLPAGAEATAAAGGERDRVRRAVQDVLRELRNP